MDHTEKQLSEKESLDLITSMINQARNSYYDSGIGLIMWGAVVAFCSLEKLAELRFHYSLPFDIYLLTLAAIIPQIFISIRDKRTAKVKSHNDVVMDYLWLAFGISIFLLIHANYGVYSGIQKMEVSYQNIAGGQHPFQYSEFVSALFLIIYGFPTFVTGAIMKFKPMLWGGIFCWACSIVSIYSSLDIDLLLTALSAALAWLVPGIILYQHCKQVKRQKATHV